MGSREPLILSSSFGRPGCLMTPGHAKGGKGERVEEEEEASRISISHQGAKAGAGSSSLFPLFLSSAPNNKSMSERCDWDAFPPIIFWW